MITTERINELLRNGEGLGIEFKRCSGKVEHDVFEMVCAFLNRFGGDILLGVEDDGTSFFREIAYADQLGSGVRNLFKYSRPYGGANPKMQEGDVFRTEVSLRQLKDLAIGIGCADPSQNPYENPLVNPPVIPPVIPPVKLTRSAVRIYEAFKKTGSVTYDELALLLKLHRDTVRVSIKALVDGGLVRRVGADRTGHWEILKDLPCNR